MQSSSIGKLTISTSPVWKVRHFSTRSRVCTKNFKVCNVQRLAFALQVCTSWKLASEKCSKLHQRMVNSLFYIRDCQNFNQSAIAIYFSIFQLRFGSLKSWIFVHAHSFQFCWVCCKSVRCAARNWKKILGVHFPYWPQHKLDKFCLYSDFDSRLRFMFAALLWKDVKMTKNSINLNF